MTFVFDVAIIFTNLLEEKQKDMFFPLGHPIVVQPVLLVRTEESRRNWSEAAPEKTRLAISGMQNDMAFL